MCGGGFAPPTAAKLFQGYASGPGLALWLYWAEGRTKGIAQERKSISSAGHGHRRTSDGKAEAVPTEI